MKNKNYYPFERNHYFYGKLLTVRDFELEQKYFNNKRRIINRLMHGAGVAAGLDVVRVDDQHISVEPGMAFDYHGREIVVQEPLIKKLHLLDGFEEIKDASDAYLCIEYAEELSEPVHTVASTPSDTSGDSQFNRISETYRLFLTDETLPSHFLTLYRIYGEKKTLFQNNRLTVEQYVPRYVRQGHELELVISITKRGSAEPLELSCELETEHLADSEGRKKIPVYFQDKTGKGDLKEQQRYLLVADNVKKTVEHLKIAKDSFSIKFGQEQYVLEQDCSFEVEVIEEPVHERILSDYYRQDFGELLSAGQQARLYLARLKLITSNDLYLIEGLEKMPYQQYVINNELLRLMPAKVDSDGERSTDKMLTGDLEEQVRSLMAEYQSREENQHLTWATGVEELDLGFENNRNKRFFTNEIAHGLGTGPVALLLAVESLNNILDDAEQHILAFGDNSVFEKTIHETGLPSYQLGALAYPNKGTFRIGLYLSAKMESTSIKIRWWAYKHPGEGLKEASLLELGKIEVSISPDTVTISPREKAHFTAQVEGTNYKECRWYVKEDKGGKIDHNGVYEAPNHEGVFEIIAESVKYPDKKGSAFVVVKG